MRAADKRFLASIRAKKPEKKEEPKPFVSKRAELLKKIQEKEQKREDKPKENPIKKEKEVTEKKVEQKEKKINKINKEDFEEKKDEEKRSARDKVKEKIKELEDKISKTKYNKSTQHAIGLMKGQVAALKQKLAGKSGGNTGHGYSVKKSGDGTVVLLGFPSSGKSTLLNSLTNANSTVAPYAFTTLTVIPGVMEYKHAKIQILDVPGIVEGAAAGTGRGKEVLQVVRTADLIVMLLDPNRPKQKELLEKEIYDTFIRLNQRKPDVKITKTSKGGITVSRTVETPDLDDSTVQSILNQLRIVNADVVIREPIDADQLIDIVENNKEYIPGIVILNKIDLLKKEELKKLEKQLQPNLCISGQNKEHLEELKELIFQKMRFIRIYLKEVNKKADLEEPLIMQEGATLKTLCEKLHRDFVDKFRFARIWGPSAKFEGQRMLKLDHELLDEDIIELHMQ